MREMKDSGVEWIGEIPKDWRVLRNKNLFFEINERCLSGDDFQLLSVSEYYGVAPKIDRIEDGDMITHAESLEGYKICKQDDIVMNIMLAWKRATGVSNFEGIISPAYCVYRAKKNANPHYYHYLFRTDVCANLFKQYSTGVIDSRLRLYSDKFFSLPMIVPSVKEQLQISTYLDTNCSRIDAIITREQAVIEKLKEYKLSLITEAVTKGLNLEAPMKDSGYEFIGKIPATWRVLQLRYVGKCQNGISKSGEFFGTGFPFVSYSDVYKNYELPVTTSGLIESSESERKNYSVQKGDIFFTRTSETIEEVGLTAVCLKSIEKATFAGFLIRVRPNKDIINPLFSKYYFRSEHHRQFIVKEMNLVTRASLGQELLKRLPVLLPPLHEQQEISTYLENKCVAIDQSISKKQLVIDKLAEYKKSLIYEVVTGKKEV